MNCQTFSDIASDIARDQMMDAAARAQALAHAEVCVNCAVQLAAQQQLTADLRELVSATEDQTASPAVWECLSAAFDERTVTPINTIRRRRIYAVGAIAAMLVLAFAVIRLVSHRQPANAQLSRAATFTMTPSTPPIDDRRDRDAIVAVNKKTQIIPRRRSVAPQVSEPQVSQPKEIATDFILLTYDGEVGSDAQMVRVELPRSAMARFGLPVNVDREDQRVKADVLLGADGLARAIRFVQ
jgi:hypothetical protein